MQTFVPHDDCPRGYCLSSLAPQLPIFEIRRWFAAGMPLMTPSQWGHAHVFSEPFSGRHYKLTMARRPGANFSACNDTKIQKRKKKQKYHDTEIQKTYRAQNDGAFSATRTIKVVGWGKGAGARAGPKDGAWPKDDKSFRCRLPTHLVAALCQLVAPLSPSPWILGIHRLRILPQTPRRPSGGHMKHFLWDKEIWIACQRTKSE